MKCQKRGGREKKKLPNALKNGTWAGRVLREAVPSTFARYGGKCLLGDGNSTAAGLELKGGGVAPAVASGIERGERSYSKQHLIYSKVCVQHRGEGRLPGMAQMLQLHFGTCLWAALVLAIFAGSHQQTGKAIR